MPVFTPTGELDPFLHVSLRRGESIYCESDAMVMMEANLELRGQMQGGFLSALTRRLANGESFFQQHIRAERGDGDCLLAPMMPGGIEVLDVGKSQYNLNDGAYLAVKLIIAAAQARAESRTLGDLIADLRYPAEEREIRIKIVGTDDPKAYGREVLAAFEERAKAKGLTIASPSYEGVRIVMDGGWALLRMSLHDPNMPLNIEADAAGGADAIEREVKELLAGFDALDLSGFQS